MLTWTAGSRSTSALEGWETDLDGDTEQPLSDPPEWGISLADETEGDES
jgi:hypothetical protein